MKKKNFFRHFVETLPAMSLLGMLLLAPMGASAQVTIGSGDLPQATLDIISDTLNVHGEAFRLIDGNQADGKVLMCHQNGIGTWEELHYIPDGGALVSPIVELPAALQANWTILTQEGVRVGAVCQIRVTVRYTGATPIPILNNNAGNMLVYSDLFLNIIHPDFIPLETAYSTGYMAQSSYVPVIHAITSSGILFRYIGATQVNTNDTFFFTGIYVPSNYNAVTPGTITP